MASLLLIRHALTSWNLEKRLTGTANPPICGDGENQILDIAKKIACYTPDYIFTSDKIRTKQTAQKIADLNTWRCKIKASTHLNEQNFGLIEGLKLSEIESKHGLPTLKSWRRSFTGRPPGGESLEEVQKRMVRFFKKSVIPKLKKEQNIVIVGHGNALRSLSAYLLNLDETEVQNFEIKNGEPILFKFDSKLTCNEWIKDYAEPRLQNASH